MKKYSNKDDKLEVILDETEILVRKLLSLSRYEMDVLQDAAKIRRFNDPDPDPYTVQSAVQTLILGMIDVEFEDGEYDQDWPISGMES